MIEIENSQDFLIPFRFPREMACEEQSQKFHACATTQNCFQLVEANYIYFVFSHVAQLIRSTTQIWVVSRMVLLQMVVLRAVATFLAMSLVRIYPGRASL